jgi:hypothetical protein
VTPRRLAFQLRYIPRKANEAQEPKTNRRNKQRKNGGNMTATNLQHAEIEESGVQKLWRAVIVSTVQEWISGPLRKKREAEEFLFRDNRDYRTVCYSAGINPEDLRRRLEKIRTRSIADLRELAA